MTRVDVGFYSLCNIKNSMTIPQEIIKLKSKKSKNFRQELESYAHFFECSGHISGIFLVCF